MKKSLKICFLCGSTGKLTDDHVPPKNVFPEPRPNNLITVKTCVKCNNSDSKDDEYFRLKICMSQQVGKDEAARINRDKILRSLQRPKAAGLKTAFFQDLQKINVRTRVGIHLGQRTAYYVDLQRIFRTVKKTVKGLFFHELGYRLRSDYRVSVSNSDSLPTDWSPNDQEEMKRTILAPLSSKTPTIIGNGKFSYRFQSPLEDHFMSAWLLTFYGRVQFLCLTGPTFGTAGLIDSESPNIN